MLTLALLALAAITMPSVNDNGTPWEPMPRPAPSCWVSCRPRPHANHEAECYRREREAKRHVRHKAAQYHSGQFGSPHGHERL